MTEELYLIIVLQLLVIGFYSYLVYATYIHGKDELSKKEKVILTVVLFSGFVITSALTWVFPSFMHYLIFHKKGGI